MIRPLLLTLLFFVTVNGYAYHTKFADSLQQEASQISGQAGLNYMLDNFYVVFNKNYEDGVQWATFARQLAFENHFRQEEGRANLSLGVIQYLHGDYEKAIVHYQEALDIFEEINDLKYLGRTHNEMTVYTRKQGQFEKAHEHVQMALNFCSECGDFECVETAFNNQGVVFEMQGEFDQAKKAFQKAARIALENDNQIGLGYIYNNFAELARQVADYDSMAYYIEKSTKIRLALDDIQGVAINYSNLGEMYLLTENYEQAERYLQKSLIMAKEVQYPDLQQHVLGLLFDLNLKNGQSDQALLNNQMRNAIKDSLLNSEKVERLSELEVRYNTEKIRADYLEEQQTRIETEVALKNRNLWIVGVGGLLLAITFFSLFLYQKKKKTLQKEKSEAILLEKEKGLIAVFDATEKERQRIAKDLHDSVGQQLSGLKLAWRNLSQSSESIDQQKEKLNKLSNVLDDAATEVRAISHQMMPKVLTEFGLGSAIEEMLDKSLQFTNLKYEFEQFNINERFDSRIEVSLYRISQELVNNVIKHSKASFLSVQLFKNQNHLILIVEDNGAGLDSKAQDGHGILNIKSRLNTINGEVNYEPGHQAGTTATVRILLA